jgi:hypothetical protein
LRLTAVELLPVHQLVHDGALVARGLRNYRGYQSIGFFAPHNEYSASGDRGGQVDEFKAMVKSLHAAGLEVILDVVFNHTAEGNERGPTLYFHGLDNGALLPSGRDRSRYVDATGTGNTFDADLVAGWGWDARARDPEGRLLQPRDHAEASYAPDLVSFGGGNRGDPKRAPELRGNRVAAKLRGTWIMRPSWRDRAS